MCAQEQSDPGKYRTWGRNRALRLRNFDYGSAVPCLVTFCTANRQPLLNARMASAVQDHLTSIAHQRRFRVWAWCIMPDHVHVIVEPPGGGRNVSDFVAAVKSLTTKTARENGMKERFWQKGFHDRVLRPKERPEAIAAYIVGNPVRKGLIREGEKWPWVYVDPQAL